MSRPLAQQPGDILCIGLICVDLVVTAEKYPEEDALVSGLRQRWQRGGNAGNDCTVLSFLHCPCECLATFVLDPEQEADAHYTKFLLNDFQKHGISIANSAYYKNCSCPFSYIIINAQTGTRTIVHHKGNLPEVTIKDFQKLDLKRYKWIHFEGRCPEEYSLMMKSIHEWNVDKPQHEKITISLEMEFLDIDHESLTPFADFVFVNKEIAKLKGLVTKEEAVNNFWLPLKKGATVIIPWGDEGAIAKAPNGDVVMAAAHPPPKVVDTLGAGDTFLSSTIFALSNGHTLADALRFGCKVSGTKCGFEDFIGLKDTALAIYREMFPAYM